MATEELQQPPKKYLGLILRAGVAIIACLWIFWKLDIKEVWSVLTDIPVWILLCVLFAFMASQIILALRWWIFLWAWDIRISLWTATKLTFLGLYFNNFLPGSVGGDLIRAWYVAKHTHKRMASVITVFLDRVLALFCTIIMAVIAFFCEGSEEMLRRQDRPDIGEIISSNKNMILLFMAVIIVILAFMLLLPSGRQFLTKIKNKFMTHGTHGIQTGIEALKVFIRKPWLLPISVFLTFFLQSMVIISFWILGRSCGAPTELRQYFVFLPMVWVAGSIPISISGIGIVEGGMKILFEKFGGASPNIADVLWICQRGVWLLASIPGLGIHLFGEHLPKAGQGEFSVDGHSAMD